MLKKSRARYKKFKKKKDKQKDKNNDNNDEDYQRLMNEARDGVAQMFQAYRDSISDSIPGLPSFEPSPPPSPSPPPTPPPPPIAALTPSPSPEPEEEEEHDPSEKEIFRRIRKVIGIPTHTFKGNKREKRVPVVRHGFYHPCLPITAPDYSYVMDITDMRSLLAVKIYYKTKRKFKYPDRTKDRRAIYDEDDEEPLDEDIEIEQGDADLVEPAVVAHHMSMIFTNAQNNHRVNRGYNYLLTILDTTSRKAWAYPLRRKDKDEVYSAFKKFLKDIHGKIARLLSDNDKGFIKIMKNNNSFTYCLITAGHNNHRPFSIIDRFTRTFRDLLYKFYCYHAEYPTYSWYDAYRIIIRTYNISKHKSLFLRGYWKSDPEGRRGLRKYYYTPDQVWYNPRLRSRIRLRMYFDSYKNYLPGSVYDRIKNADMVRVREWSKDSHKGGENFFKEKIYKKGMKRGNSWFVNGTWYSYRNLWPVDEHQAHDEAAGIKPGMDDSEKTARRDMHRDKYKFRKVEQEFMDETEWAEEGGEGEGEYDDYLEGDNVRTTQSKALDVGRLIMDADPDYAEPGETAQDVGIRAMEELKKNPQPKRNLRESTKNPQHIHKLIQLIEAGPDLEPEVIREIEREEKLDPETIKRIKKEAKANKRIIKRVKKEKKKKETPNLIKRIKKEMGSAPRSKVAKRVRKAIKIKTEKGGRIKFRSKRNKKKNKKKHTKQK